MRDIPSYMLVSVAEVEIVENLARALLALGVKILATDGTHKKLLAKGIENTPVSEYTGVESIAQGRVKTIHPRIFGGILAERNADNQNGLEGGPKSGLKSGLETLQDGRKIFPIDYVVVQPYQFSQQVQKEEEEQKNKEFEKLLEYIDIGGIALLRAAAKNYKYVCPLHTKEDCDIIAEIINIQTKITQDQEHTTLISQDIRSVLAAKVFQLTSLYDAMVADWMSIVTAYEPLPKSRSVFTSKALMLRYGENPNQAAALYFRKTVEKISEKLKLESPMLCRRSPSYNNLYDAYKATQAVISQEKPCCAIVKHGNICGLASAESLKEAFQLAHSCDDLSAYGGIIALNRTCDEQTLLEIKKYFFTVIAAPEFATNAVEILVDKKPEPPILLPYPRLAFETKGEFEVRSLGKHALLLQVPNEKMLKIEDIRHKGEKIPTEEQKKAMLFAFEATAAMTSNAIAIVRTDKQATIGLGCGQTSRVDAAHVAIHKAQRVGHKIEGSVAAADGFIPFTDTLEILAQAGVKAVLHPGGGKYGKMLTECANKLGIVFCSTDGVRNFSH